MANCQNKCFISLVVKALEIRRKFKLYTAEKEYAKAGKENVDVNKCLCTKFSKLYKKSDRSSSVKRTGAFNRFLVEDSTQNFILKSVFGFLGGILLTYICFMFLVFSLNFTLKRATYICMGLGVILSLGLAFSVKIRCTVFLCIPQLFSKRGRQALLAYAFILALSGPAKNTLHNVEVMSESLACAEEQLKQAENELLKCVHKPNAAAKKSIENLLEKINFAVKDFKNFILQLYKNCFDILETVLQGQKWLYSITLLCKNKMGKPAHHCLDLLSDSIENCQSTSSMAPWKEICTIDAKSQQSICSTSAAAFCMKSDIPEYLPVVKLQKQLEVFKRRAMNTFYVKIEAHQTYSQSNRSYTYHEEYQGMATEIRQKTDQFLQYFDFMSVIFGIFILVLFVKVIIYRHKFLTEDHYDNRYITSDFVDIDNTRAEFQMETLLPLEPRERMQYIKVTSMRLVPSERVRLLSSFVFLIFATFKIIIHILTDSSLYWILTSVRRDERFLYMSTLRDEEPSITVHVAGNGLVAGLLRNVTRAVKRQSTTTRLDPTPCLPDPVPPDWNRYYQILALVIICWLLALCEPYGLRLRHTVMVTYHPDRARERAIWLYNRIISNRTSFAKISRREIRRKYKDVPRKTSFRFHFMKKTSSPKCLLCKNTISSADKRVECPTLHCAGMYCDACFASLKFCSICSDPAAYGDLSDLSEEKDSSEEEFPEKCPSGKKGTSTKKVDFRECKKEKLSLNLKKPNFNLKDYERSQRNEKSFLTCLIQPTLLYHAIRYCRSKIPAFKQLRNLSDVESSDWDLSSTLCTDFSSLDDRFSDNRKSASNARKRKDKKKSKVSAKKSKSKESAEKCKSKESSEKSSKKKKGKKHERDLGSDKKAKKSKKNEKVVKKVCLFEKVFPLTVESAQSFEEAQEMSMPHCPPESLKKDEEEACQDDIPRTFLTAKDSVEQLTKKRKTNDEKMEISKEYSVSSLDSTSVHTQVLFLDHPQLMVPEELEDDAVQDEDVQEAPCPSKHDIRSSDSESRRRITFPFIDPVNIHEFALVDGFWDKEDICDFPKEPSHTDLKKRSGGQDLPTRICFTPSCVRVCIKKKKSSEMVKDKVRVRDATSTESESQFYTQPYWSSNSSSEQTEIESAVKRASGKINLNVKVPKQSSLYSIETDSSNDKFLSVKPTRREKLPTSLKMNLEERNSSEEGRCSDKEDLEHLPVMTVFPTEEEFQQISVQMASQKMDEGVDCSRKQSRPNPLERPPLKDQNSTNRE